MRVSITAAGEHSGEGKAPLSSLSISSSLCVSALVPQSDTGRCQLPSQSSASWGLCGIRLQSLSVLFPDMRAEEVTCSWVCQDVSRLLLAAGLVPPSYQWAMPWQEKSSGAGGWDSPRVFPQAQKSHPHQREDWLLHGWCLSFRGPFLLSIFQFACSNIFFFNFLNDSNYFSSMHLFSLLRKY